MRTVIGIVKLQQLFDQFVSLLIRHGMPSLYSRLACHGSDLFPYNLRYTAHWTLGHLGQYLLKQFLYIVTKQVNWHPSNRIRIHAKIFDLKSKLLKILLIAVNLRWLFGRDAYHDWWSQCLCLDIIVFHFGKYLFVLYLLMCSMLVNHQHFVTVLYNPISVKHLSYYSIFLLCLFCENLFVKKV